MKIARRVGVGDRARRDGMRTSARREAGFGPSALHRLHWAAQVTPPAAAGVYRGTRGRRAIAFANRSSGVETADAGPSRQRLRAARDGFMASGRQGFTSRRLQPFHETGRVRQSAAEEHDTWYLHDLRPKKHTRARPEFQPLRPTHATSAQQRAQRRTGLTERPPGICFVPSSRQPCRQRPLAGRFLLREAGDR